MQQFVRITTSLSLSPPSLAHSSWPHSSSMAMASSNAKLSYQKLRHEAWFEDEDEDYDLREKVIGRLRSGSRSKRFHIKRRMRVKIPNLKRLLRRKARLLKFAWRKVCKRLKESQSHFGDLFAGNYMFMQVTPTPLKYLNSKAHDHVHAFTSNKFSTPRVMHD